LHPIDWYYSKLQVQQLHQEPNHRGLKQIQ
jgi:hypothetical protein